MVNGFVIFVIFFLVFSLLVKVLTLPLVERGGSCLLRWPERCEDFGKT